MRSGCEITWQPVDKNLGFAIVQEVTGKKGTVENPVLVDEEQAEKIRKLYEERNNDPKEPAVEPKPDMTATLVKEVANLKIDAIKDKQINKKLGQEVASLKIQLMQIKGGK
jgi:hypothetical protein